MDSIDLHLTYDGVGPAIWRRNNPAAFGLQDKAGVLHLGTPGPGGTRAIVWSLPS